MKHILITTTPTLSNANILEYYGIITTNVVIGVNFFSDFVASFSDVFGGNSSTYQRKLDGIYREVINGLEKKAMKRNANAIIGLHIDFDEISGKGKQMFMATAIGTACKIELIDEYQPHNCLNNDITDEEIERLCTLRKLQHQVMDKKWIPENDTWEYIISHHYSELAPALVAHLYEITDYCRAEYLQNLKTYLFTLTYDDCVEALYPLLEEHSDTILKIIKEQKLFNPQRVLVYIEKGNLSLAISLLKSTKMQYSQEDLTLMEQILLKLNNLPDIGKVTKVVSGLFSKKEEEVYICPNGHKNSKEHIYCNREECGKNIKGLTKGEVEVIDNFTSRVNALRDILKNRNLE